MIQKNYMSMQNKFNIIYHIIFMHLIVQHINNFVIAKELNYHNWQLNIEIVLYLHWMK